jgi:DHA1 family multidrug resistance protein-like MFS transporter
MTSPAATYAERNAAYWKRNLAVCVFGSFTTLLSLTMLLPFLPLYVEQLGVHGADHIVRWSSYAFSATFVGTALTAPVWGRLADRYGRKVMLVRAAVGMAVVMSLIGMATSVTELVILRLMAGLLGGYASASTVMIGSQVPGDRAGWALGVLSTGALCGSLVGPLVGGFLPEWVGIRGTFFVGGALITLAAVATVALVREEFSPVRRQWHGGDGRASSTTIRLSVLALMVTAAMVMLASMSIEPIITVYIQQMDVGKAHVSRYAGIVMAATAFGSMLAAPRLGALADRVGAWRVIVGCLIATALALIPQALASHWWQLCALRFLMGMTIAGLLPSIGKLIRGMAGDECTGRLLGFLQSAQFSGQVAGPLLGGEVGARFGESAVFLATAALLVLNAGFVWRYRKGGEHGPAPTLTHHH